MKHSFHQSVQWASLTITLLLGSCSHIVEEADFANAKVSVDIPKTNSMMECLARKLDRYARTSPKEGSDNHLSIGIGTTYDESGAQQVHVNTPQFSAGPHPSMGPYFMDSLARLVVFDLKRPNPPDLFTWPKILSLPEKVWPNMLLVGGAQARDEVQYDSANTNFSLGGIEFVLDASQSSVQVSIWADLIDPKTGELWRSRHRQMSSNESVESMAHTKVTVNVPISRASFNLISEDVGTGASMKYGPLLHRTLAFASDVAIYDLLRRLFNVDAQACLTPEISAFVKVADYGINFSPTVTINPKTSPESQLKPKTEVSSDTTDQKTPIITLMDLDANEFALGSYLEFRVSVSSKAHLACFYQDELGKITRVLPVTKRSSERVPAGWALKIPDPIDHYAIELAGAGSIHEVLCTAHKTSIIERLPAKLAKGDLITLPIDSLDALLQEIHSVVDGSVGHVHQSIRVTGKSN